MKKHTTLLSFAIAACLASTSVQAEIEPAARELAKSVSAKLGAAQTIKLTAKHQIHPALGFGAKSEQRSIAFTVKRPNQFYSVQSAGGKIREIAFDGMSLCVIHPAEMLYAIEPLKAGSIEQLTDRMDDRFGFRPPVGELLAKDVGGQLFRDVTSARVMGTESVGWTRCERLHFEQPGMTGDLWVGVKDKLPRRYLLTFTDIKGNPTWDIKLSKWELNVPVDDRLFTKRPPAGSNKVKMFKSR